MSFVGRCKYLQADDHILGPKIKLKAKSQVWSFGDLFIING